MHYVYSIFFLLKQLNLLARALSKEFAVSFHSFSFWIKKIIKVSEFANLTHNGYETYILYGKWKGFSAFNCGFVQWIKKLYYVIHIQKEEWGIWERCCETALRKFSSFNYKSTISYWNLSTIFFSFECPWN